MRNPQSKSFSDTWEVVVGSTTSSLLGTIAVSTYTEAMGGLAAPLSPEHRMFVLNPPGHYTPEVEDALLIASGKLARLVDQIQDCAPTDNWRQVLRDL